jgi:hypothetical protein
LAFDEQRHRAASTEIAERVASLATRMVEDQFRETPGLRERLGETGYAKSLRDAEYNLQFLAEAVALGDAAGFGAYLAWLDTVLTGAGLERSVLDGHLDCMTAVLSSGLDPDAGAIAVEYVRIGREALVVARSRSAR